MTLVAVSKGVPASRLAAAVELGLDVLGENRVQEAADKVAGFHGVTWHMVGHLQGNKVARAVELFATVQSVDSLGLARRLDRAAAASGRSTRYPVFLQVNIDGDPAKSGFSPEALEQGLHSLASLEHLELCGLMTIGRISDRAAPAQATFAQVRALSERLRDRDGRLGAGLSMGMSDDFEVAVEQGATVVRIGRALFGARPSVPVGRP